MDSCHIDALSGAGRNFLILDAAAQVGWPWRRWDSLRPFTPARHGRNRGSALLGWVGHDAALLGAHLDRHLVDGAVRAGSAHPEDIQG